MHNVNSAVTNIGYLLWFAFFGVQSVYNIYVKYDSLPKYVLTLIFYKSWSVGRQCRYTKMYKMNYTCVNIFVKY